jgi:hypothetical protein
MVFLQQEVALVVVELVQGNRMLAAQVLLFSNGLNKWQSEDLTVA